MITNATTSENFQIFSQVEDPSPSESASCFDEDFIMQKMARLNQRMSDFSNQYDQTIREQQSMKKMASSIDQKLKRVEKNQKKQKRKQKKIEESVLQIYEEQNNLTSPIENLSNRCDALFNKHSQLQNEQEQIAATLTNVEHIKAKIQDEAEGIAQSQEEIRQNLLDAQQADVAIERHADKIQLGIDAMKTQAAEIKKKQNEMQQILDSLAPKKIKEETETPASVSEPIVELSYFYKTIHLCSQIFLKIGSRIKEGQVCIRNWTASTLVDKCASLAAASSWMVLVLVPAWFCQSAMFRLKFSINPFKIFQAE
jgi:hypothetical protein